jgi:iron complex outermembrane receptor protein
MTSRVAVPITRSKLSRMRRRSFPDREALRTLSLLLILTATVALKNVRADAPPVPAGPTALKNLSLEDLSQIEVTTPSKEPVTAMKTPAAIYVLTGEDIRRYGATSIPEALRLVPGVEVARIDGNNWSVGIRGFGSDLTRSVLVLIDGRTVYTPLFAGTNWDAQNVLMDDIDRIEVIRGPGGTIWGPNAVNGVINIITKDSKDTQGLLVSGGTGNFEHGFLNMRYGGGNGSDFSYRVYGMGFDRSPEYHPDGQNFDEWWDAQAGFRMDWKETRDTFTLQGDFYDEQAGKQVNATSYAAPYSQIIDGDALIKGQNILGRWKRIFSDGNDIQVQAYFDRTDRRTPNYEEVRDTYDIDFLQRLRLPWRQEISWGLGARVDPVYDPVIVTGLQFAPFHRTDYLATGFIQDEIGLVEQRLSLILGTKLLRTNFTTGVDLEPSVQLLWTPSDKQTFWAAYTHALRTPSDSEENFSLLGFVGSGPGGTPVFARFNPNSEFVPEQLNGYEVGYRRTLGHNVFVDVTAFYNHYHDLFSEDLAGATFLETSPAPAHYLIPAQFRNDLLGNTKGIEIAPEWRVTENWRLRGSYSYLHMSLDKEPGSGDLGTAPIIAGSSPKHEVTMQSAFDLTKRLQLDLTYRYVDALPGLAIPAYSTADARIGWRFNREWDFSVVGRNLTRPAHLEYSSDPGPLIGIKRSVFAKLTWTR